MEQAWFVNLNGQNVGPLSLQSISEKIKAKEIHLETPVWKDGLADWRPLGQTELKSLYEEAVTPVPPVFEPAKFNVQLDPGAPVKETPVEPPVTPVVKAVEYAGFWVRFFALCIDHILMFFVGHFVSILIPFATAGIFSVGFFVENGFRGMFLNLLYFGMFQPYFKGTLGKKAMGILVVDASTLKPMTIEVGLMRFLAFVITNLFMCIGSLWVAFDEKKQGLYDKIAKTSVVYVENTP